MKKVFVGGSKYLKALPPKAISLLNEFADEGAHFLVGDCAGTDTLVQTFLRERGAKKVRIYTAEDSPRNNLGTWKVTRVQRRRAKIWPYLRQKSKDFAMAEDADCAFMVWDGKSKGTFSDILQMLYKSPIRSGIVGASSRQRISPAERPER